MISSRDLQEIVSKLSADKAKSREEGVKLLNTWLDGERSVVFCHYLGRQTAALKPNQIPHSETWPFLVSLLVQCVSSEVSSSKRRLPKLSFAKTLRIVVPRAEDAKFSGKPLPLLPVVKMLFSHVWEILSNVPSFQSEYAVILRHLLSVRDYRFHLRSRVYCRLVLLYLEKVESSLPPEVTCSKEEVFRYILTLHSLLENPPGDFPDDAREAIIKGLTTILSLVREEGKISRKPIECVNTFLLKDGPNLGSQCLEIHEAMRHFVFHVWTTTHDRGFKDVLYSYAALQLNLSRGTIDDIHLVDQILDMVCKDLDQAGSSGMGLLWGDVAKDEKFGSLRGPYCKLVEMAALGFYRACVSSIKVPWTEKRVKREPPTELLKEALMKGKWLWHAAFLCLIRKYSSRMSKDIFTYWFEGISTSFESDTKEAGQIRNNPSCWLPHGGYMIETPDIDNQVSAITNNTMEAEQIANDQSNDLVDEFAYFELPVRWDTSHDSENQLSAVTNNISGPAVTNNTSGPWSRIVPSAIDVDFMKFSDKEVADFCYLTNAEAFTLSHDFMMPHPAYLILNEKRDIFMLILHKLFFIQKEDVVYVKFPWNLDTANYTQVSKARSLLTTIHKENHFGLRFRIHAVESVFLYTFEQLQKDVKMLLPPEVRLFRWNQEAIKRSIVSIKELIKVAADCMEMFQSEDAGIYLQSFSTSCEDMAKGLQDKIDRLTTTRNAVLFVGAMFSPFVGALVHSFEGYVGLAIAVVLIVLGLVFMLFCTFSFV